MPLAAPSSVKKRDRLLYLARLSSSRLRQPKARQRDQPVTLHLILLLLKVRSSADSIGFLPALLRARTRTYTSTNETLQLYTSIYLGGIEACGGTDKKGYFVDYS